MAREWLYWKHRLATKMRLHFIRKMGLKLLDLTYIHIQMMTRKNMKLELRWEENYDFTYKKTYSSSLDRR